MQDTMPYKPGDRVRHDKRPEWGIGSIQRVENARIAGKPAQRLVVRFPNAGLKTLSSLGAPLTPVQNEHLNGHVSTDGETLADRERATESGWLGEISKQKPEDAMVELPGETKDPFASLESRLRATFELYRFEPNGRGLIDWAVARSGLDDPLSRFTRHELEQFFERWSMLRQKHLDKLLEEARHEPAVVQRALKDAPPAAQRAAKRGNAAR